ncbi:hypothetical protein TNCV_2602801 [Trichonephila clavipes]|nr:hypothetical protein TNCV_2602801 [Trichonephila clavipes]
MRQQRKNNRRRASLQLNAPLEHFMGCGGDLADASKSVEAQIPPVGVVWNFGKEVTAKESSSALDYGSKFIP